MRQGALAAAFAGVTAVSAGLWALWAEAERARVANAAALAVVEARDLGAAGQPEAALAAARRALALQDGLRTRSALVTALLAVPDALDHAIGPAGALPARIAYLPDGRLVAAATDGTASVIDGQGARLPVDLGLAPPGDQRTRLVGLFPVADGVLAVLGDGAVRLLDGTGRVTTRAAGGGLALAGAGADGLSLSPVAADGAAPNRALPAALPAGGGVPPRLAPGGARAAFGCDPGVLCVAPVGPEGGGLLRLPVGKAGLADLAWSPDGARLATLDISGTIRVWTPDPPPLAGAGALHALQRDPDRPGLLARGERGLFRLGRDGTAERLGAFAGGPAPALAELAGPDGAAGQVEAADWTDPVALVAAPGGLTIAFPYRGREVALIRTAAEGAATPTLSEPLPARPSGAVADPASDLAYVATTDGAIRRPGLSDGAGRAPLLPPGAGPAIGATSLSLSPDGALLAATLGTREIALRRTGDGSVAARLPVAFADTKVVAFAPEGLRLAILSSDGRLDLWGLAGPAPEHLFSVPLAEGTRRPVDLDWLDADRLALVTPEGARRPIDTRPAAWAARADRLLRLMPPEEGPDAP